MNWLHCNKCGVTSSAESETEFLCGTCSHVLCSKCSEVKFCPIDKRPFSGVKVNSSMPEKLRPYFEDPSNLLSTWQKCIRFQCEQRKLYEVAEYTKRSKQMRQYKEEINVLIKTKAVLKENIEKEVKRNNKLKSYISYCLQKQAEFEESSEISTASTQATNFSSMFGESGVDMQFDDINSST